MQLRVSAGRVEGHRHYTEVASCCVCCMGIRCLVCLERGKVRKREAMASAERLSVHNKSCRIIVTSTFLYLHHPAASSEILLSSATRCLQSVQIPSNSEYAIFVT